MLIIWKIRTYVIKISPNTVEEKHVILCYYLDENYNGLCNVDMNNKIYIIFFQILKT